MIGGRPLRVAFVGQATYFAACVPSVARPGLDTLFVDHRTGDDPRALLAAVCAHRPDAVVVFRPETVPAGLFATLDAVTLGYVTEPLPRPGTPPRAIHPDLHWRLSELVLADAANFDRLVSFDPLSADGAGTGLPVWRSVPLPVDDAFFAPVRPSATPPRVSFVGYSTAHRERLLVEAKHYHDIKHVAHGIHGERLRELFHRTDVGINLHGEAYLTFENRVSLHLAAGHLVISEPLSPAHGLEPGLDHLEIVGPWDLNALIGALRKDPDLFAAVRHRGRRKAEQFRAGRVWPRLLGDLLTDVRAFGGRTRAAA